MWKGYLFLSKIKERGTFSVKKVYKRVRSLTSGQSLPIESFVEYLPPSSRVSERSYKTINNIRSWWSCCLVCTVNNKKDLNMSCYQLDITIGKLEQKHLTFWWITNTWGLAPIVTQIVLWQIKGTAYLQEQANFSDNDEIY